MPPIDHRGRRSGHKLLSFPRPPLALREADGGLDLDLLPHDIGTLRRPLEPDSTSTGARGPVLVQEPAAIEPPQAVRASTLGLTGASTGHLSGALTSAQPHGSPEGSEEPSRSELAQDARRAVTSLLKLSGLLEEPGTGHPKQYAADLRALVVTLSSLIEQLAIEQLANTAQPSAEPVFALKPLRSRLPSLSAQPRSSQDAGLEDAGALVKSCEPLLSALAGPRVALQVSLEPDLGVPMMPSQELTQVLIHLVKNASEAISGRGHVTIAVRKGVSSRRSAIVSVQDTGAGIPAHELGQIFQAGFSSKQGRRRWPATVHQGLGLTIVRELVEGAGGSVRVSSALARGTKFEIVLPCRVG